MSRSWTSYLPHFLRERLDTNPLLRRLVGNTGWLLADRVLRMGVGLVVSVWVSRYLGPERFGLYSYLIALVALLTPLANLGLDQIIVRDLVANSAATRHILGTAFAIKLVGGSVVLMLSIMLITLLHPGNTSEVLLIAIIATGPLVQALDVTDLWFQSQTSARFTVYAKGIAFLVATILRVAMIVSNAPLIAFIWVALAEIAIGSVGSAVLFHYKSMPLRTWRVARAEVRHLLSSSWPLLFSGLAVMIYMKIDIVMLNNMRGEAETGLYAAAVRISEVWYFIPLAINTSVMPMIIAAKQDDEKQYYGRLKKLCTLMVWLALAFALPISFLSYPLIDLLYGDAYRGAAPVLSIHIWAAVFVFMGVAQSPWDIAEDLTRLSLYRTLGGAVINIALNIWLIPSLGALGAAIATSISYACSAWLLNIIDSRSRRIFAMQTRALNPFTWMSRA
jgi:polysaccharide transporter, PST family